MKTLIGIISFLVATGASSRALATDISIPMIQCNYILAISAETGRASSERSNQDIVREACETHGEILREVSVFRADINELNKTELLLLAEHGGAEAYRIYRVSFESPERANRAKEILESGKVSRIVVDPRVKTGRKGERHDLLSSFDTFEPSELILFYAK